GMRAYLAVDGGIAVPLPMGSASTDLMAGFGGHLGRALRDGDRLPLG
ncbi:biotin-dependent carboxyltransferase family protein, partial [Chromobacterium piscinae]